MAIFHALLCLSLARCAIRGWWQLYRERGEAAFVPTQAFQSPPEVDRPHTAQDQIVHLERLCGQQALELDLLRSEVDVLKKRLNGKLGLRHAHFEVTPWTFLAHLKPSLPFSAQARLQTFLEDVYNAKRLHSSLDYVPPDEFELKDSMC